ncbi:MAG: NADH-quinone oxidoreductase subunit A [Planctomycetaceae bacterium]|nr:NADH-quinone oxidoreductase subunit A [Planctomycetaceae bacterium]
MTDLVGHFLIFTIVATVLLVVPLLVGRLVRPWLPTEEKDSIYECGEPTIGTSYIQFDLRFYVVALLFIIFDVEVAFFFPWALVFGGATQLMDPTLSAEARSGLTDKLLNLPSSGLAEPISAETAHTLALTGLCDILVFFGVLLVGFAYVWKRGDLDWVRAMVVHARQARTNSTSLLIPRGGSASGGPGGTTPRETAVVP